MVMAACQIFPLSVVTQDKISVVQRLPKLDVLLVNKEYTISEENTET